MAYSVQDRSGGSAAIRVNTHYGEQLWLRYGPTRRAYTCVVCKNEVPKGLPIYRPHKGERGGYARMCVFCAEGGRRVQS